MKETDRVIRSQKDLDMLRREEEGMFYIAIAGQVATFNGKHSMTLVSAYDRMAQIAAGQSENISKSIALGNKKEAIDAIGIALQTFVLPYRMQ
jgi:hypothetical protein